MSTTGRIPPSDTESEKAVLAAIMIDNTAFDVVFDYLDAPDFYMPAHESIFEAMCSLHNGHKPLDLVVIADWLKENNKLEIAGGAVALAEISDYAATSANVEYYSKIVRDKAMKREIIRVAREISEATHDSSDDSGILLDQIEGRIFEVSQRRSSNNFSSLKEAMNPTFDHIEAIMSRNGELTGVVTGLREFDAMTGGLQEGDLAILAARPSMGKTALALNMARNVAFDSNKRVAVFSLEMTTRSLVMRLLSAEAGVDFSNFHKGIVSVDAHSRLSDAADKLSSAPLYIDDSGSASILEIRSKCRRLHAQSPLNLVIVDYMQLARGDGTTNNREQEISQISRGLKALAKELNCPVLALSQLNRGPESRGANDKRPMLSDLRESGAIEQDADIIGFIYRDVVYNPGTEFPDRAELILGKQRNGPVGTIPLHFENRYAKFSDWTGPAPSFGHVQSKGHSKLSDMMGDPESDF